MDAARQFEQLALDCLNLAEGTRDLATQDQLIRLAEFCARLADHAGDNQLPSELTKRINPPH
jgi:hypothetical protein